MGLTGPILSPPLGAALSPNPHAFPFTPICTMGLTRSLGCGCNGMGMKGASLKLTRAALLTVCVGLALLVSAERGVCLQWGT